jgi:hypothetical protein
VPLYHKTPAGKKDIYFIADPACLLQDRDGSASAGTAGQGFPCAAFNHPQMYFAGPGQLSKTCVTAIGKGLVPADECADRRDIRTVYVPGK